MFTLIVSAALVLSNVSLFWVLVNLLKPSQRRLCSDERAPCISELELRFSLSKCATVEACMRETAYLCGQGPFFSIVWRGRQLAQQCV